MWNHIPKGFVNVGLVLTFDKSDLRIIEGHVLRMLTRDYHILYTKKDKFDDGKWTEIELYCKKGNEASVAYHIGCLNQTMLQFYRQIKIIESTHAIPDNFPESIQIESEAAKKFSVSN